MYVIDQNNIGKMYYLYTDHLGSPNLITDAQCNVVEELSFDAWGNRRYPSSWQPYNSTATVPESFIDRGFTFHACPERPVLSEAEASRREHLYPFTLINMNGRAYDPLVGRFLSPDPYIQAPDNTQNLNRYSYCLNNPLIFTDPSGEFIFTLATVLTGQWYLLPMAIGADIGMYAGGSIANGTINPFKWDYSSLDTWSGMAMGALAGGLASQMMFGPGGALMGGSSLNLSLGISNSVGAGFANFSIGGSSVFSLKGLGYVTVAGGGIYLSASAITEKEENCKQIVGSKWQGSFFQGSEYEAISIAKGQSYLTQVETKFHSTTEGFYFEPIFGFTSNGFRMNSEGLCYTFSELSQNNGVTFLKVNDNNYAINYSLHIHPKNSPPSSGDRYYSKKFNIYSYQVGYNNDIFFTSPDGTKGRYPYSMKLLQEGKHRLLDFNWWNYDGLIIVYP